MKNLVLIFLVGSLSFCAFSESAKVKIVRGEATMLAPGMKEARPIKKGDILPKDSSIVTKPKSFVRVVFPDKSSMNIGPKSMVVIKRAPKKKANMVNLLTGIIKAEVKKNSNKQTKTKMVIKTRSAIMGVRGTKFQSTYNPVNKSTSLVTVEGKVAIVKVAKKEAVKPTSIKKEAPKKVSENLENIDEVFDTKDVIEVPAGRYSGVVSAVEKPTVPVKIAPKQYNAIAKSMGSKKKAKDVMKPKSSDVNPDGFENKATGELAPKAGGFVDFSSGIYIPPATDAVLDKKTGTFKAKKVGTVNKVTGDYIPPKGIRIDDKKGFVIDKKVSKKLASNEDKEQLKQTLAGLNKDFKKQVKVNKIENKKISSKSLSWLPKNHVLSAQIKPYSEVLNVKNSETNSDADFFTESARWIILTWHQDWNSKWSSRFKIGGQNYEIDESDVEVYDNGGDDDGGDYFSAGIGYKYSKKMTFWVDLVDRSEFYVVPSSGDGVEIRSQSLNSFDFTADYSLKKWRAFDVSLFGTLHLIDSDSVPGVYGGDESADFFSFSLGSDMYYSYKKNLGIKSSAWYSRTTADADSIEYTRSTFGLGFDFIYDI